MMLYGNVCTYSPLSSQFIFQHQLDLYASIYAFLSKGPLNAHILHPHMIYPGIYMGKTGA